MIARFTIPGPPQGKGRPRFTLLNLRRADNDRYSL